MMVGPTRDYEIIGPFWRMIFETVDVVRRMLFENKRALSKTDAKRCRLDARLVRRSDRQSRDPHLVGQLGRPRTLQLAAHELADLGGFRVELVA